MRRKITWRMMFTDFKRRHPHLSKQVVYWSPHDYGCIIIYLKDGMKLIYNCDDHKAQILSTSWKHD